MDLARLKEDASHGSCLFHVKIYNMFFYNDFLFVDFHWHDEYEFLILINGSAKVQIETAEYEMKPGDVIFVNKKEIHAIRKEDGQFCEMYAIVVHQELINSFANDSIQLKYLMPLEEKERLVQTHIHGKLDWERDVYSHLCQIIEADKSRHFCYELFIKSRFMMIFYNLLAHSDVGGKKSSFVDINNLERLKIIIKYIRENYGSKITIKEMAGNINMSEGHFCRFFKEITKKTPIEYLNHYRINEARARLTRTDNKILNIAMDVGFENFSYFIKTFKKITGVTPSNYRKEFFECLDN